MQISLEIRRLAEEAEIQLKPVFDHVDAVARKNTEHVLDCFREAEDGESMFTPSTSLRRRSSVPKPASCVRP